MKETLFSLVDVSFAYGECLALDSVILGVNEGEIVGVIGPNGSGKSTLLKILGGYLAPERGEVKFCGREVRKTERKTLAKSIAVLPQMLEIPFPYTVEEFILMGRYPHSEGRLSYGTRERQIARDVMDTLDLALLAKRPVNALSGGERQKVALAQCIAQEPRVLLLDEPVSHLDIKYQMRTLELLGGLNERGLTVLMVLHDLNLAAEFCSRIILLSGGRIYADGNPDKTLTYQGIEEVYGTVVIVKENPLSRKPYIIPVSKKYL